ncbi:magnesium transporter MgtE N-terminal domain-containing protein [Arcanobacterium bovis]|uniref:Magnesium transporter n=1 Tax=Arcanobacterium bovis TaxID=2529275 RepID=A0A4Q9V0F1_9ACTO|nr:CBS domain-containing protein [Arcanobacterium bovis]TBW22129.1 magnesium transporter [Arcanobacterium bovis]
MSKHATNSRIFVGRLAGTDVFDPIGDRVGKVKDVVVVFRLKHEPLAVGLVVEVAAKRRVFVPLTRVMAIENGQVITTGLVNIRRFSQRPVETMVVGEILDREVVFKDGSGVALVEDVAIEMTRSREWRLTQLYVRMKRGYKDAGNTLIVPINEVTGLASKIANQAANALIAQLDDLKAPDVADVLRELPDDRVLAVANQLSDDRLADVLEELGDEDRVAIVSGLDVDRAAEVLEIMQPDDAADLVADLPTMQAEMLLSKMEPDEADDVRRLMSYGERTAGGLMTTEPIVLPPDATVATALAHARRADIPPALATMVFVCRPPLETPTGRFLGVVHLQRALREPPSTMLGSIVDNDVEPLEPTDGIGTVTRLLATYNLTAIPVLDEGQLIGAVSVDDVLDHLLPEHWREYDETLLDQTVNENYDSDTEELEERAAEAENREAQLPREGEPLPASTDEMRGEVG